MKKLILIAVMSLVSSGLAYAADGVNPNVPCSAISSAMAKAATSVQGGGQAVDTNGKPVITGK